MKRYDRNKTMISESEQQLLAEKRVCVIGCGGLGGYSIEMLTRLGIGHLTVVDGDVFDETNLNRQLLSNNDNLGQSKAFTAYNRIKAINPTVSVTVYKTFFNEDNADEIITGHDVVVDALDKISVRKLLEKACEKANVPMVHGAIAGWYGQVATIFPGDRILSALYPVDDAPGMEAVLGNPSFTPATISSVQVSEVLKLLLYPDKAMHHELLYLDLLLHTYEKIKFESYK